MALFGEKETKEDKEARKERELLERYGVASLSSAEDLESVKKIAHELVGTGLGEASLKLGMAKAEVTIPISYQRAIMEQNFIMIRQLDRIASLLDKE